MIPDSFRNKVILGDALEVARTLPDGMINLIVTSPPYYSKRDYGTAAWIGGDPSCGHNPRPQADSATQLRNRGATRDAPFNICPRCGAVREDQQIGLESDPQVFIDKLVALFTELRRALAADGNCYVNMGDSRANMNRTVTTDQTLDKAAPSDGGRYGEIKTGKRDALAGNTHGIKEKDLIGIPYWLAMAMRADGWYWREMIVWNKPGAMPESVQDRCTDSHEYILHMTKSPRYYYNREAVQEIAKYAGDNRGARTDARREVALANSMSGTTGEFRNKRNVWTVATGDGYRSKRGVHYATYPRRLIRPCLLAGSREGDLVYDPFMGSGTTAVTAVELKRLYCGSELNPEYMEIIEERLALPIQPILF